MHVFVPARPAAGIRGLLWFEQQTVVFKNHLAKGRWNEWQLILFSLHIHTGLIIVERVL